ncbi:MAG: hypothetical protein KAJ76_10060 [Candidatus Heimdallarchaeota archaeon]|nr:hypothetical protein [Candidatus Heimdallarchaeota archaeon]MCK5158081.1 hypothetical protein [Candidatus Heimdallarchaeota archaeon]MCK5299240.1 hypothetical protein [Candidatus Heimdallarchaeota archaeon]
MSKRKKEKKTKKDDTSEVAEKGKEIKKEERIEPKKEKKRKGRRKARKEKVDLEKIAEIENNAYNLLFDDVNLFLHELPHMSLKALRQRLILIDGKMLWLEKISEIDLLDEEGSDDIIDMEMEMLEMGLDLETADEMKSAFQPETGDFNLSAFKAQIEDEKTLGESIKDIVKEIEMGDLEKPIDELMTKFILYDLRAQMERAINEVFKIEGKIKKLKKQEGKEKEIKALEADQKHAANSHLKDVLNKIKKEKPKMILSKEFITEFKQLTNKKIAALKAREEKEFEQMVDDLLKE